MLDKEKQDPVQLYENGEITKQKMFNMQDESLSVFLAIIGLMVLPVFLVLLIIGMIAVGIAHIINYA